MIVNLSASPYHAGKGGERERMLVQRARDSVACVLFCNLVGGQDELVFDGHSVALDQDGELLARAPQFEEALVHCTIDPNAVVAARLRDPRHRAAVRGERERGRAAVRAWWRPLSVPARGARARWAATVSPIDGARGGGLLGAAHRRARLRRQERLRAGGARRSRAGSTARWWR